MKWLGLSVLCAIFAAAHDSRAQDLPAAWPTGWREGYQRFERFLKFRQENWPTSTLRIEPDGTVATGFQLDQQRESAQSLQIFQDGIGNISSGMAKNGAPQSLQIFRALVPNRLNAGVVRVTTVVGYQHILPIVWFEVLPESGAERRLFGGTKRPLKILPPPEPAEDYLPNDRFLQWLDFQVLGKRYPHDIRAGNIKVSPAVFLQVDRRGVVHRKKLTDRKAEAALEWRFYFNGRLKVRSAASDIEELSTARFGPGNYIVLAGISGPQGFFPVSNLLQFNLAPGSDQDGLELLFSKFDYGDESDYPGWYREVIQADRKKLFHSDESLLKARALASVWRGCADLYNDPKAKWILGTGEPAASQRTGQ